METKNWPEISYKEAKQTYHTIHLWTQIVGKIKLANLPWINHSWQVTLMVTPVGLTSGDIPFNEKHFQINFNFLQHHLQIITSDNEQHIIDLKDLSVASCYNSINTVLNEFGILCEINPVPNEMEEVTPFYNDYEHATYNPEHAKNLHKALLSINVVFTEFRSGFIGKCSPVHFFWGAFDLAVSRFSGKKAPLHPGGMPNIPDWVVQEAYSHEVSSCGFWPGNDMVPFPAFYSYIYPEPAGYKNAPIKPSPAYYQHDMGEFILPYKDVQQSGSPSLMLLEFLKSTYEAAAKLAGWDRDRLENTRQIISKSSDMAH